MMTDPVLFAQRWVEGINRSGEKVRAGVQGVTVNPAQTAITRASTWQTQVSSSRALEKYKSGLGRVTLQSWQSAMTDKGIPNMGNGARLAQSKMQAFATSFLPFVAGVTTRTRSMPSGGLENGIARMNAQARGVAQYKRS